MELVYRDPGLKYIVDGIMMFQSDDNGDFWRKPLFSAYPQIDRKYFDSLDADKRYNYINSVMKSVYENESATISDKLIKYNEYWKNNKEQVEEAFGAAFQLDCRDKFNNIVGNITLNPIEPRWLDATTFDVFYLNSERGALGTALHEITHFVWFYVWQRHFQDDASEYETPHLKWVFSEMVVDPIMRGDARLKNINPYFDDGCAYSYFYNMTIDGTPILETLYSMYRNLGITDFMERGYDYCVKHEDAIITQMK